ncbi:MAG: hypothetical protein ACKODV_01870, partial [Candidatus Limnocylindrus sp.]
MSTTHVVRRPLRYLSAVLLTALIGGLLSVRLVAVQASDDGAKTRSISTLSDGNRIIEEIIAPPRGLILDR